jgi:hypothetical protein
MIKKTLPLLILISLSSTSFAGKLVRPPDSITGIGGSRCSEFITTYDEMQRIKNHEEKNTQVIAGTLGAYGDYTGTFGGFFASAMMEHGDKKLPWTSYEQSMALVYNICKEHPEARYIDIVWIMSETAFGRYVK